MCEADYIIYDFIEDREIIAQKQGMICTECSEPIAVGEKYVLKKWKGDGVLNTYRSCMTCKAANEHLDKKASYTRAYGCLVEDCYEELAECCKTPEERDELSNADWKGREVIKRWASSTGVKL